MEKWNSIGEFNDARMSSKRVSRKILSFGALENAFHEASNFVLLDM